jgi:hypothetical protein
MHRQQFLPRIPRGLDSAQGSVSALTPHHQNSTQSRRPHSYWSPLARVLQWAYNGVESFSPFLSEQEFGAFAALTQGFRVNEMSDV